MDTIIYQIERNAPKREEERKRWLIFTSAQASATAVHVWLQWD